MSIKSIDFALLFIANQSYIHVSFIITMICTSIARAKGNTAIGSGVPF